VGARACFVQRSWHMAIAVKFSEAIVSYIILEVKHHGGQSVVNKSDRCRSPLQSPDPMDRSSGVNCWAIRVECISLQLTDSMRRPTTLLVTRQDCSMKSINPRELREMSKRFPGPCCPPLLPNTFYKDGNRPAVDCAILVSAADGA
jgi:hypothetical protein